MGLPEGYVLEIMKPLYGIPDSGLHWYLTYMTHNVEELGMYRSRVDPCILLRRDTDRLLGIVLLQVDVTLGFGNSTFFTDEERASKRFKSKPRTPLTNKPVSFNGLTMRELGPEPTSMETLVPLNNYSAQNDNVNTIEEGHDNPTPLNSADIDQKGEGPHATEQEGPAVGNPLRKRVTFDDDGPKISVDEEQQHDAHLPTCAPSGRPKKVKSHENRVRKLIMKDVVYKITQEEKIEILKIAETARDFVSNRALAQYAGVNFRPDIRCHRFCAPVQLIAPGSAAPSAQDILTLKKVTRFLEGTFDQGLALA